MDFQELNTIRGLKNGDEETYIYLFQEYYVSLCAYSRRYVGRKDVAEEIVSEVFFNIWNKRETIQINKSIKSYLFQAVCNNSLYYLRKLEKEKKLEEYFEDTLSENISFPVSLEEISEQSILKEDINKRIEEAVYQLPEQQQKAFKLKRFDGKKNKEVAEIMGLSVKTVEMHLSKAMLSLREKLKDCIPAFLLYIFLQ